MNKYVFDWIENCEYLLKNKRCFTSQNQYMELRVLIRYLQDQGYDKESIYKEWLKIDSKVKMAYLNKEELQEKFEDIYKNAQTWKLVEFPEIEIYQGDLDRINALEVLPWIKEYLLTLLCIYKYYNVNWCPYSKDIKTFCYSMTRVGRERERNTKALSDCLSKYNIYQIAVYDSKLAIRWAWKNKGLRVATIRNPRHAKELFPLIENKKKCKDCGKDWEYNEKSIGNELCPQCHKKLRIKKQNDYKK